MSKPTIEEMVKALEKSWYFTYPKDRVYSAAETEVYRIHIERCFKAIRALIGSYPDQEVAFVRHIEKHLTGQSIPICKICGKTILEIYDESRRKTG